MKSKCLLSLRRNQVGIYSLENFKPQMILLSIDMINERGKDQNNAYHTVLTKSNSTKIMGLN